MKLDVIRLDAGKAGSVDLDESIFGLEPRADILHRVVRWQRAKAQAGTHSTLGKSDVSYSTKKIYKQKGTGGARHGSRKAPIFRHGGVYKGPQPRSHAHDLPKKFRALGLKHALSAKAAAGELILPSRISESFDTVTPTASVGNTSASLRFSPWVSGATTISTTAISDPCLSNSDRLVEPTALPRT